MIAADRDRLRELINNLIDNAIRYSHEGGRVTVRHLAHRRKASASWRSATTAQHPGAERQRIFERFHRLLGTQEDGSGLGLAIVSEIATCTARASRWKRTSTAWATPSACSSRRADALTPAVERS
jgi:two-component system sensor histidine kinase TctE